MLLLSLFVFVGLSSEPAAAAVPGWPELRQKGEQAEAHGDIRAAEQYYRDALARAGKVSKSEYFVSLEDLGTHYWKLNDARSAQVYFRAAVEIMDTAVMGDSRARPVALSNLAAVLRYRGEFEESERLQMRALLLFQAMGAAVDVARCHAALAELSISRGDYGKAGPELRKAADMLDGDKSAAAGGTLVWVAQNFLVLNMIPDAAIAIDRAGSLLEQGHSPDPHDVVSLLDSKGALLFKRGHYAEAQRAWTAAVAQASAAGLSPTSSRMHLAQLYSTLGQFRKAESAFTELLQQSNPAAVTRGVAYGELAWALLSEGETNRAEPMFRSAVKELEGVGLQNCSAMATLYARYAELHIRRKQWDDALPLLRRAIEIGEKTDHPRTAEWLLACAGVYKRLGDRKAASDCKSVAKSLRADVPDLQKETVDIRELEAARERP